MNIQEIPSRSEIDLEILNLVQVESYHIHIDNGRKIPAVIDEVLTERWSCKSFCNNVIREFYAQVKLNPNASDQKILKLTCNEVNVRLMRMIIEAMKDHYTPDKCGFSLRPMPLWMRTGGHPGAILAREVRWCQNQISSMDLLWNVPSTGLTKTVYEINLKVPGKSEKRYQISGLTSDEKELNIASDIVELERLSFLKKPVSV